MIHSFFSESPADGAYAVTLLWPVAWGDLDAFGHVNNTQYFRYFEHVRIQYFREAGVLQHMSETNVGPILARTDCRFRIPTTYPDTLTLAARVASVNDDRFVMHYRVTSQQRSHTVAYGSGEIVMFDYTRNKKAAVPETIYAAMERIESTNSVRDVG